MKSRQGELRYYKFGVACWFRVDQPHIPSAKSACQRIHVHLVSHSFPSGHMAPRSSLGNSMDTNLDIYLPDSTGMIWMYWAKDLSDSESRISQIAKTTPGTFLVSSSASLERVRYECAPDGKLKRLLDQRN